MNPNSFDAPTTLASEKAHNYVGHDLEAMSTTCNYPKWIRNVFRPYLHGKVAEVGAGSGNFTTFLLEDNIESITAFEPCREMYVKLQRRFAGNSRIQMRNEFLASGPTAIAGEFDAIVYNNVLEHVEDDGAELRAVHAALKPGGRVLIFVPAMSWLYSAFDRSVGHYRRYHKSQGARLLLDAGFHIETARYADIVGIVPWLICMRLFNGTRTRRNARLYDRIGVPITRVIDKLTNAPIGKNLILVGQKPHHN